MKTTEFQKIWRIMESSFPPCERRSFDAQKDLCFNPLYEINPIFSNGLIAGFISFWYLDDYIYIEHLAIDKHLQGQGLGKKAVLDIIKKEKPIVLEVEIPSSNLEVLAENRRIRFYEQLGFVLLPFPYYQPAYDGSGEKIPLSLMIRCNKSLNENDFISVRNKIYKIVHGIIN